MDEASSFYDYPATNLTQARFVKKYKKEIDAWLKSKRKGTFAREIQTSRNIGIYVPKKGKVRHVKKATVVLGKNNSDTEHHLILKREERLSNYNVILAVKFGNNPMLETI